MDSPVRSTRWYFVSYGVAVLGIAAALGVRYAFSIAVGPGLPIYLFFCPVVIVIAYVLGTGPGLVATAAAAGVITLWVYPARQPSTGLAASEVVGVSLFLLVGILVSVFASMHRRMRRQAAADRENLALRESEARFSTVFHSSPISMSMIRRSDGVCIDVNQAHVDLFGYSREETVGHTGGQLDMWVASEDRARVLDMLAREQRVRSYEADLRRKDGTIVTALLSAEVITMGGEQLVWMLHNDISERKRSEEKLRLSESGLRALVDTIPESVILIDREGTAVTVNETFANRFGRTNEQIVGTRLYDLFPPDLAAARKRHVDEVVRTGEPRHFQDSRAGRHLDNRIHPIVDAAGRVVRLAILSLDITERKEVENKLKEQAALLDIASDAILTKDLDGRIVYWNKGAQRMYGWSAEEAVGKKTLDLLYPADRVRDGLDALRVVIDTGEWRGELHQRTRDGSAILVEARWTLIRDERGEAKGILSVKTDITAKRSIEAQLLRSQRLESLGTLAGGIAHDLNNVLAPILMGIEGLSFSNPDASARNLLDILKTSTQRGASIVRQILDFARGMEGRTGEIQLTHVLRDVENIVNETFPKSIVLRRQIPGSLSPVNGDATQLHQVLMNLCLNARDAMPAGGVLGLTVEQVRLDEESARMNIEARAIPYVVLGVEDTGTGMTADVLEKIFDPFFTTKEPGKGTGLGLSTVRSIVKNHGGFITVSSEPGMGASFKVYLPAADHGATEAERRAPETIPLGKGESILVVDDEASLRALIRHMLEFHGYRVMTAADGSEAVALFREKTGVVRAVITDMMMPRMDGAATIRAIREINPATRFIATSGLAASEDAKEARELGVQAFLAKPFTAAKLLQAVKDVISAP
jgi:two-component system, cell cycle sensor histidine kinase and response regulator CckA